MFYQINEYIFAAGLFINAALFLPQIVSLLKYKDSREVSLITFAGFCLLQISTIIHGFYKSDFVLAAGFGVSLLTCGTLTFLIILYRIKPGKKTVNEDVEPALD